MRIRAICARSVGRSASELFMCSSRVVRDVADGRLHRRFGDADRHGGGADLERRQDDAEHHVEPFAGRRQRAIGADVDVVERHRRAGVAAHAQPAPRAGDADARDRRCSTR